MIKYFLVLVVCLAVTGVQAAEPKPEPECPWIHFDMCSSDPDWQLISQKKGEPIDKEARYIKLLDGYILLEESH